MGVIEQILNERLDNSVSFTISAADLKLFAEAVARETGVAMANKTVSEIKRALGDTVEYCSTAEAMMILGLSHNSIVRFRALL